MESLNFIRKYSSNSFPDQRVYFITNSPEKAKTRLREERSKININIWNICNEIDMIKEVWVNKAECRGI
jgi:hypothetical protein